jgi:oligoribonuclease NrnB/cAMP/cGMP phosphodiesterase (DHH superfamily)
MSLIGTRQVMPPRTLVESLDIRLIVADGDFDGLVAAAVLNHAWPNAEIIFSHPAEIRSGYLDHRIDEHTALCDLPFHSQCGLYIDHHATNRPTEKQEEEFTNRGGHVHWRQADSAARVAYDLFKPLFDLSSLTPIMDMVDRLDGGRISRNEFLSNDPTIWLARTVTSSDQEYTRSIMDKLVLGMSVKDIVKDNDISSRIDVMRKQMDDIREILDSTTRIENRLAICELQETGLRTNGYLVTAHYGDACDACLIIHGSKDGKIGEYDRWPLTASFYSNSFLHTDGGVFDLSTLATMFDKNGGGHQNACGCQIKPLNDKLIVEKRALNDNDLSANISAWINAWNKGGSNAKKPKNAK